MKILKKYIELRHNREILESSKIKKCVNSKWSDIGHVESKLILKGWQSILIENTRSLYCVVRWAQSTIYIQWEILALSECFAETWELIVELIGEVEVVLHT